VLHFADLNQPPYVVGYVGHVDLGSGAGDADGVDDHAHNLLLIGEDMLNRRPMFRVAGIASADLIRHLLSRRFPAVDMADKAPGLQKGLVLPGAVGTVGPDPRASIALGELTLAQEPAIEVAGVIHVPAEDEAQGLADRRVRLVPESGNGNVDRLGAIRLRLALAELNRQAGVHILLPGLVRLVPPDLLSGFTKLDCLFLAVRVALLGAAASIASTSSPSRCSRHPARPCQSR